MNIGIMGGTFDPPHLGHILPVAKAADEFSLDKVWFVPTFIPPHKTRKDVTDPYHRAAMVAIALQPYPRFLLSTEELSRGTVRYTVDTIKAWKDRIGSKDRLFFILGADSFLEIETWRSYRRLLQLCDFIIINRGADEEVLKSKLDLLQKPLQLKLKNTIHFSRSSHIPISSTELRKSLRGDASLASWLPPGVWEYISKHSLYQRR